MTEVCMWNGCDPLECRGKTVLDRSKWPPDTHTLTPGPCEHLYLTWQSDFADVIKVMANGRKLTQARTQ